MSLIYHDAISLAIEAFGNAGKLLWLIDDDSFGNAGPALAGDLRAIVAGTPTLAHFIATTSQSGLLESCGVGADDFIEFLGSRRYGQCSGPCSETVWRLPPAGEAGASCPACGLPARENIPAGAASPWVSVRLEQQEIALAAWKARPGGVLAIELGGLAGSPQLRDLARRSAATVLRCGAGYSGAGPGATIALALPPGAFVALLRERLSSSGLIPA